MDEWRQIPDWPAYEVSKSGQVRKICTGQLLTPHGNQVRLAHNKHCRSWRTVQGLVTSAFGEMLTYIAPVCRDCSEPGEEWRRVEDYPEYMVSSHGRVWSWASLSFLGSLTKTGETAIHLRTDRTVTAKKLHAEIFGYSLSAEPREIWKESNADGIMVSNYGRLYSKWRLSIIKPCKDKSGYISVTDKNGKKWRAHRLVAEAFLPRIPGKDVVDHIDENKSNNRVENLRWCTLRENIDFYLANHTPYPIQKLQR